MKANRKLEGIKIKKTIITEVALLLIVALVMSIGNRVETYATTQSGYSPALIGELGEASTVLVYSQIDATVKIYLPDMYWVPTTQYILVPVSVGAMASGFFVNSNGYIATAGHAVFCFTHTDFTQDLYTKYFLIYTSFEALLNAFEAEGYYFTPEEQASLLAYVETYGEIQDSIRQVYAVLGEVKATLTDVQSKGWLARVVAISPYIERDIAILKVELTNCPVLTVGDSDKVVTGDDVSMFGFPAVVTFHTELGPETTLAPSMTRGIISAKRTTNSQTPCFQTDAMITHGNSGGPGLNNIGEAIGVCSRGSISETGQQVAGFDFIIQSNVLKSFLTENSVSNQKGPVDNAFLQGLQYFYAKHYSLAKQKLEACTGLFDYHWRAQALIKDCNAAIARDEDVPLPTAHITPLSITITLGQSVPLTSTITGGTTPYTYQWYQNGTSVQAATSNTWSFTPTTANKYAIYLNVTDANGEIAQSETAYVSVAQPQGIVLGDSWMLILVLIAVVAVVAVIALVLVTRRAPHPASSV
jgi:S1-C subfamily serine protease